MNKILSNIYANPSHPGGLGSISALQRTLKGKVKNDIVTNFLKSKQSYTLHKPARRNFKRNRVIVSGIDEQFQCDLVDVRSISKFNDGFKYILTCIDVFSKYAFAIPLKNKSGENVKTAFEKIFKERIPDLIQSDKRDRI